MREASTTDRQLFQEIVAALEQAGFNSRAQLTGYLRTGEDTYITRTDHAREKIKKLDLETISQLLSDIN